MLFAAKRDAVDALGLSLAFVVSAVLARRALGIEWSVGVGAPALVAVAAGVLAIFVSDALLHALLSVAGGGAYRGTFRGLAEYFRGQTRWAMVGGGVLAGSEELVFRGVLLLGLVQRWSVPEPAAVLVAALAFGATHVLPERRLHPMALWATVEGVLLGGLLVVTGSLLVPVAVHALHDVLGFALFAALRGRSE